MKFELTRNYKLAFKLLNDGVILAAWLDWERTREVCKVFSIRSAILINQKCTLPTVYDEFEAQCQRLNIDFLIPEDNVKKNMRDRSRESPPKSIDDLRKLMGTEKEAVVHDF